MRLRTGPVDPVGASELWEGSRVRVFFQNCKSTGSYKDKHNTHRQKPK